MASNVYIQSLSNQRSSQLMNNANIRHRNAKCSLPSIVSTTGDTLLKALRSSFGRITKASKASERRRMSLKGLHDLWAKLNISTLFLFTALGSCKGFPMRCQECQVRVKKANQRTRINFSQLKENRWTIWRKG